MPWPLRLVNTVAILAPIQNANAGSVGRSTLESTCLIINCQCFLLVVLASIIMPSLIFPVRDRGNTISFVCESVIFGTSTLNIIYLISKNTFFAAYSSVLFHVLVSHMLYSQAVALQESPLLLGSAIIKPILFSAAFVIPLVASYSLPAAPSNAIILLTLLCSGECFGVCVSVLSYVIQRIGDGYENILSRNLIL